MPVLPSPSYRPPVHQWNRHLQTILPNVFRKVEGVSYVRERIATPDNDFLDLDWSYAQLHTPRLAILTHGLLGNSQRPYMLGMARLFNRKGWDVVSWNMRGLGGEPNRLERMTTHGGSDELVVVIEHILSRKTYSTISLIGFSKGGNIALKYAGEQENSIPAEVKSIVAISAPVDVWGSIEAMGMDSIYARMFRDKLKKFLINKSHIIAPKTLAKVLAYQTLTDMTNHYIAPLHGFRDVEDYCVQCSALPYLPQVRIPSLLVNALNDPVLSLSCSPTAIAEKSHYLFLENPALGGHVGFSLPGADANWIEERAYAFATQFT